jgi:serine protease Do
MVDRVESSILGVFLDMLDMRHPPARKMLPIALALLALGLYATPSSAGGGQRVEPLPAVFDKPVPEGVDDLKAIQQQVKKIVDKVMPCTVCLQIGASQGSGVIINKEGYILTAAHVSGEAGRAVRIILHDGRLLKGTTLGGNVGIDSGLVKITTEGAEFPSVGVGRSADVKQGQWVVAIGHPGGYQTGRQPVVRVGRLLETSLKALRTDCTLVGGDSGGPLFDMNGRVIGIHSRIAKNITANIHVPVDTFTDTWDRLAAGEVFGDGEPYLGVRADTEAKKFRIVAVLPDSPAAKAGLRPDDVILKADNRDLTSRGDLDTVLRNKTPGNQIALIVRRGDEQITITVTLGKRPSGVSIEE